ncbi:helix-turn-helix domain-containing protein [Actinomadura hibisca]|uniref:helix-turn-helix domain-containing protein n=1 Tax=Actinomadura hibisca TaxID=68565 RepID=UPI001C3F1688
MTGEQVRLQAARWFAQGRPSAQVATELRVGLRQAEKWRQAWRRGGVRGAGGRVGPRTDTVMTSGGRWAGSPC